MPERTAVSGACGTQIPVTLEATPLAISTLKTFPFVAFFILKTFFNFLFISNYFTFKCFSGNFFVKKFRRFWTAGHDAYSLCFLSLHI